MLLLAACSDPYEAPHWENRCANWVVQPMVNYTPEGRLYFSFINQCVSWRRVCVWGKEYPGPKKCDTELESW